MAEPIIPQHNPLISEEQRENFKRIYKQFDLSLDDLSIHVEENNAIFSYLPKNSQFKIEKKKERLYYSYIIRRALHGSVKSLPDIKSAEKYFRDWVKQLSNIPPDFIKEIKDHPIQKGNTTSSEKRENPAPPEPKPLLSDDQLAEIRKVIQSNGINTSLISFDVGATVATIFVKGFDETFKIIGKNPYKISWRIALDKSEASCKSDEELYQQVSYWAEALSPYVNMEPPVEKEGFVEKNREVEKLEKEDYNKDHIKPAAMIFNYHVEPIINKLSGSFVLSYKSKDRSNPFHAPRFGYIFFSFLSKIKYYTRVIGYGYPDPSDLSPSSSDDHYTIHVNTEEVSEADMIFHCRGLYKLDKEFEPSDFNVTNEIPKETNALYPVYSLPIVVSNKYNYTPTEVHLYNEEVTPTIGVTELAAEITTLLQNIENNERGRMIGIFGQWGRGKTFLWKQIEKRLTALKKDNPFITLEFHAWKYQDTPAVWAYLYENIAQKYFGGGLQRFTKYTNVSFRKYNIDKRLGWTFIVIMILAGLSLIYSLYIIPEYGELLLSTGIIATIVTIFSFIKKNKNNALSFISKFGAKSNFKGILGTQAEVEKELKALLKSWIPNPDSDKRILLFVDDIDRCSEDKIIQIIDALKVMLEDPDISSRVLVLTAIDERVLQRAINVKYKDMVDKDLSLVVEGSSKIIDDKIIVESDEDKIKYLKSQTLKQLVREYMDKLFIAGIKLGPLTSNQRKAVFDVFAVNREKPENVESSDTPTDIERQVGSITGTERKETKVSNNEKPVVINTETEKKTQQKDKESQPEPDTKQEEKYTLSNAEYEAMTKYLDCYHSATPRSIRIFYFRYLLARNLLHEQLGMDSSINKAAKQSIEELSDAHHILAAMLVHYGQFGLEDFAEKRRELMANKSVGDDLKFCNETFSPSWELYYILLRVVEMTVPY